MTKHFVIYDGSGAIISSGKCPSKFFELQLEGHEGMQIVEGEADPDTHYVLNGVIIPKGNADTKHTISGLIVTFFKLPIGTCVSVNDQNVIADQSGVELEFDIPGTYKVHVKPPVKYKAEKLEVTVG